MIRLSSVVAAAALFISQTALSLTPDASIRCSSSDAQAAVPTFNFDLYLTGHPQGGAYSYTGMFEADAPSLPCGRAGGNLRTTNVNIHGPSLTYSGESDCLDPVSFTLTVQTIYFEANRSYPAQLDVVDHGPLGNKSSSVKMECASAH